MNITYKVSGKKGKLQVSAPSTIEFSQRPGGWVIVTFADGSQKRLMMAQRGKQFSVNWRGISWNGEWNKQEYSTSGSGGGMALDDSELIAQFPGKVRKVLTSPNKIVQEGDSLLLVEAMKMEFAVRAPYSGKVTRILVQEGQQLQPGDRFVDLEPAKGKTNED